MQIWARSGRSAALGYPEQNNRRSEETLRYNYGYKREFVARERQGQIPTNGKSGCFLTTRELK